MLAEFLERENIIIGAILIVFSIVCIFIYKMILNRLAKEEILKKKIEEFIEKWGKNKKQITFFSKERYWNDVLELVDMPYKITHPDVVKDFSFIDSKTNQKHIFDYVINNITFIKQLNNDKDFVSETNKENINKLVLAMKENNVVKNNENPDKYLPLFIIINNYENWFIGNVYKGTFETEFLYFKNYNLVMSQADELEYIKTIMKESFNENETIS
jgi:hypothetical protein